jgi:hypothetical protein
MTDPCHEFMMDRSIDQSISPSAVHLSDTFLTWNTIADLYNLFLPFLYKVGQTPRTVPDVENHFEVFMI